MSLLFVIQGDEQAKGPVFEMGSKLHNDIMTSVRSGKYGSFPLVRRLNNFYGDVSFEYDEIASLIVELKKLGCHTGIQEVTALSNFCKAAILQKKGIDTIAD